MAKLTPVIIDESTNSEGKWNVKIRLGHKSKNAYIGTEFFVEKKHLTPDSQIKPKYIIDHLSGLLSKYNAILKKNKEYLPELTHLELKDILENNDKYEKAEQSEGTVMFLDFCKDYISGVSNEGTAGVLRTAYLSLKDYLNGNDIPATQITSKFLKSYEEFLKVPRVAIRGDGENVKRIRIEASGDTGIHTHMSGIRRLLNWAKEKYNDEELGVILIPNDPFKKYKIVDPSPVEARDYTIEQILKLRDLTLKPKSRAEMARDLWFLSFCLCGMNTIDMRNLTGDDTDRIEYNRSKTKKKRADKALISIKLIPEALPFYKKYAGKLQVQYKKSVYLNYAVHMGMVRLRKILGKGFEDLDLYSARHSFASLAANELGYSISEIGEALNHEQIKVVTNRYIRKSWKKVDEIQAAVVSLIWPAPLDVVQAES